jgi:hypothetical protein
MEINARLCVKSCAENRRRQALTHFYILTSMASEVLDPLYAPIEVSIDVDARQANVKAEGLVEAKGTPIIDAFSQKPVRAQINLPDGFEYRDGHGHFQGHCGPHSRAQWNLRAV